MSNSIIEGVMNEENGTVTLAPKLVVRLALGSGVKDVTFHLAASKSGLYGSRRPALPFEPVKDLTPEKPEWIDYAVDPILAPIIPLISISMFEIMGAIAYGLLAEMIVRRFIEAGLIFKAGEGA